MKVLLDAIKLKDFSGSSLGVVVALSPLPPEEDPLVQVQVVVGVLAAVERARPVAALQSHGLPSPNWEASAELVRRHYPAGTRAAGVWLKREGPGDEEQIKLLLKSLAENTNLKDVLGEDLLVCVCGSGDSLAVQTYHLSLSASPPELTGVAVVSGVGPRDHVDTYLTQHTALLRVCGSYPVHITTTCNIEKAIGTLVQRVKSSLFMLSTEQVLFSSDSEYEGSSLKTVCPERFKTAAAAKRGHNDYIMAHTQGKPLLVDLLETTSPPDTDLPSAPSLSFSEPSRGTCVRLTVPVDVLGLVRWDSNMADIASLLKDSICSQLQAVKDEMAGMKALHSVSTHHFTLSTQSCPVTVICADMPLVQHGEEGTANSLTNTDLHPRQTVWCEFFGLPSKSSQLRILHRSPVGADLDWIASHNMCPRGPQPLNPHLAVKQIRVRDGRTALVQGNYLYYHYMQQNFNDNGWGCAYRSLQTLWSWFLLQGYTEQPVPDHSKIQETLVKVGDKEKTLIGSKDWIGSFEVSTVLNQLLGIECRIHYSSSGDDMASTGRVLLKHFQTEATPVMIGGGVLAHTILGVDFSASTGEIQFLILDPHYTGRDDLKTILDKGWCGWKPLRFWSSKAHYNMCMPLVPDQ